MVHTKHTGRVKRRMDDLVIFAFQETKNDYLFDKNRTQDNIKCHIQLEES